LGSEDVSRDEHTFLGDEAFEEKNNPVKHILAEKSGKREGEGHKMA
jgi:hypothetical protein